MSAAPAARAPADPTPHWRLAPGWSVEGACALPEVTAVTEEEFRRVHMARARPLVLRGHASSWRMAGEGAWAVLRARVGHRTAPAVVVTDGLLGYAPSLGMRYEPARVADVIDEVLAHRDPRTAPRHFLTVDPREHLPELLPALDAPPWVRHAAWQGARVSVGGDGTVTPVHVELYHNVFTVLRGEKELILFAPTDTLALAPYSPLSGVPHLSRVDPRDDAPEAFPRARRLRPLRCVLRDGDGVFIPRGWWHAVRTNAPTIATGAWWADGLWSAVPRAVAFYKRTRAIQS